MNQTQPSPTEWRKDLALVASEMAARMSLSLLYAVSGGVKPIDNEAFYFEKLGLYLGERDPHAQNWCEQYILKPLRSLRSQSQEPLRIEQLPEKPTAEESARFAAEIDAHQAKLSKPFFPIIRSLRVFADTFPEGKLPPNFDANALQIVNEKSLLDHPADSKVDGTTQGMSDDEKKTPASHSHEPEKIRDPLAELWGGSKEEDARTEPPWKVPGFSFAKPGPDGDVVFMAALEKDFERAAEWVTNDV